MKDQIIELENNFEFYVLDEIKDENGKYIYCVQLDEEKNLIIENYIICKVSSDLDGNEYIEKITEEEFEKIGDLFVERLKDNN